MRQVRLKYILMAVIIFPLTMCRKSYDPPVIKASNHFIAIDGLINTSTNGTTSITINRSLNLQDTVPNIPELNCTVLIQSETGATIPLIDTGTNGVYISPPLNLDPSVKYQVSVTTSDGNKYISDLVLPKTSPPIDSITWQLINDP